MLNFFKKKPIPADAPAPNTPPSTPASTPESETQGLFQRLKSGLTRSRKALTQNLANLFLGKKTIDSALLFELETILLTADIGVSVTESIIQNLSNRLNRNQLKDGEALMEALQTQLLELLSPFEKPLSVDPHSTPYVILMVGVNGAGKTTTIGKLAYALKSEGKKVLLAAGDTFRAAAVEQLQTFGHRTDIPIIAQQTGADSASVIFDAFQAARAKKMDVLIADTAGRLHTQDNLMAELQKITRVIQKCDSKAPHEVLLVLDATNGQNAIAQAQSFHKAVGVTGLVLTKLDGTAKGGAIFAIAHALKLPIRYVGIGEALDDLKPFEAKAFVDALFETHAT